MKKSVVFLACLAAPVSVAGLASTATAAEVEANKSADVATAAPGVSVASVDAGDYVGESIYSADGKRLGAVYGASSNGSAQIILGVKMAVIPASTLSVDGGKLSTSLTRKEVMKLR